MLSSLASVCSRWWRIIVSTPSLWTIAKMADRPDLVVKKSKTLLFKVHQGNWYHSEGAMRHFADVVGPHARRWQSLFLQTRSINHILPYLDGSLPWVETLILGFHGGREGAPERLTLGDTPKLRRLGLYRIVMNWDSITQMSLETLYLKGLRRAHVPTMQQLYQILVSNPQLRQLTLLDLDDPVDAERFSAKLISLKRLNKVEIRDVGEHTLVGIMKMLQAENLSSFATKSKIRHASSMFHLANLLRPSSAGSLLPYVLRNQGLKSVYVKISLTRFMLSDKEILGDMSGADLALEFQGIEPSEVLDLLGPPDRGYDVDLNAIECELRDEELIRGLRIVNPSVLRIGYGHWHLPAVMEALSKVPASSETWFCSNLGELHLSAWSSLDFNMVARVVQLRPGLTETGVPPGRSRLLVYDAEGRVFNPETVSFEHRSSPSMDTSGHQNVV